MHDCDRPLTPLLATRIFRKGAPDWSCLLIPATLLAGVLAPLGVPGVLDCSEAMVGVSCNF